VGLTFLELKFIQLDAIGSKIGKWDGAFMNVRSFHPLLMGNATWIIKPKGWPNPIGSSTPHPSPLYYLHMISKTTKKSLGYRI